MPGTTGCPVFHSCTVSFFQSVRQSTGIKKFFHCILIFKGYDRLACFLKNFLCMAFLSCQTIHFLTCRNFFIRSFDQIHMINEPVELTYWTYNFTIERRTFQSLLQFIFLFFLFLDNIIYIAVTHNHLKSLSLFHPGNLYLKVLLPCRTCQTSESVGKTIMICQIFHQIICTHFFEEVRCWFLYHKVIIIISDTFRIRMAFASELFLYQNRICIFG